MRMTSCWLVTACTLAASSPLLAGHSDFGTITSEGEFRLNQSTIRGNATLVSSPGGAVVESLNTPSRLRLSGGGRIELAPGARARVWADRLVLEKGGTDFTIPQRFSIEAHTLRFSTQENDAQAKVALRSDKTVQVAALTGRLRVQTAAGILVSNVHAGMRVAFTPQFSGQAVPSSVVGCLLKKDQKWIVYDPTAQITVELLGSGFEKEWGNRVQANGTARAGAQPAATNVQVLDVTTVTRIEAGGCAEVANAINAQLPPGAQPATAATPKPAPGTPPSPTGVEGGGMSAGTKVAIIGGIGAGAGVGAVLATRSSRSN
jgi:hypothetical protein